MDLVLQGINTHQPTIEALATLVHARHITMLQPNIFRCQDVNFSTELKSKVEAASFEAKLDYAFIATFKKLSDFKLVAMDMDSTLITIECIDEIADMQGLKPRVAEITEAAMRGEIEFRESLMRRVALLKGLNAAALEQVYEERLRLSPGAEPMLEAVKAAGLKTLLVSGGFTFFTDRIKARLGLDYAHSNQLEIIDGKLTGQVVGSIVDAEEKKRIVETICQQLHITPEQAIVIGDGANDLKMLSIAGLSVAFRAKPIVRTQTDVALNFVGLDGILALCE